MTQKSRSEFDLVSTLAKVINISEAPAFDPEVKVHVLLGFNLFQGS